MPRSRRQQFNPINAPALARWIVVTAFLSTVGLIYVYLSLQLYDLGKEKHKLEQSLASLQAESKIASDQIAALTSYPALQRRQKEGYLRMQPIAEQNIVRLNLRSLARGETENPAIANLQAGK